MEKEEQVVGGIPYGYIDHYETDLLDWEIIAVEEQVRAAILDPKTGQPSETYDYGMVLDMVVRERSTGEYVLVEHKTTSQLNEAYWRKLELDPQLSGYWLGCHAKGWPITKIIYNVIKLPGIRQRQTESRKSYYDRIREELTMQPEKYFHRKPIYRTQEQLLEFLDGTWRWIKFIDRLWGRPMQDWLKSDIIACTRFNRTCEFLDVCAYGMEGPHMSAFYKRDEQHPEFPTLEEDLE